MPTPPKPRRPASSDLGNKTSSVPGTRLFFVVFDETPDEAPPTTTPVSAEQSYRDALEHAVDSLLSESQTTVPSPTQQPADERWTQPAEPLPQAPSAVAVQPAEPSQHPETLHSTDPTEAASQSELPAPAQPPVKRKKRGKSASSPTTQPPPVVETRLSSKRIRVRREFLWSDDNTRDSSGS
jgi:hypothetical protein